MRLLRSLVLLFTFFFCEKTQALEVGFDFTGTATTFFSVFGVSGSGVPVTGSIFYDTSSTLSSSSLFCPGAGCGNYEQEIVDGFSMNIGGVEVSADNYIIQVVNDHLVS